MSDPAVRIIGYAVSESRPWNKMVTWDRTPLGVETVAPCHPRAAPACGSLESTLEAAGLKLPALQWEAALDTTGSFSRQPPVHTWNGGRVQGPRPRAATLRLIRRGSLKLRLTLRFYCGNRRLPGGKGFVGEPRKSSCFTGMRASVRCSIAVFRRHSGQRRTGPVIHPDNCLEFSHCC